MKKSGQVMLTAVFLTAISSASANAQEVAVPDTTQINDSAAVDSNVRVNYDNPDGYATEPYQQPPVIYNGFFTFHWLPWRRRYYYPRHHQHQANGGETHQPRATAGTTGRNGFRSTPATGHATVAATPQANGFGGTMRGSTHTAHS